MKPKTMILMGLAIVCGLGASYMTSRLLAERTPAEDEKVAILVAKRHLSVGERINKPEELFEVKEVTKENEPPDAIKEFEPLRGKFMKQSRNKGDHITVVNLYDGGGLDIPDGHQAVGLRVTMDTSVSGLATLPGSRVDLIWLNRGGDIQTSSARILLQNVLVLAADIKVDREGGAIAAPAQVVTFALSPEDMLRVSLAKDLGVISLSLRKLHDDKIVEKTLFTGKDLLGAKKEEPKVVAEAAPPPPPAVEPTQAVELPKGTLHSQLIINGERVQNTSYRRLDNGDIRFDDDQPTPAPQVRPIRQQPQPQPVSPSPVPPRDF